MTRTKTGGTWNGKTPAYAEAAVKVQATLWACVVCGNAWDAEGFDAAEVAARACHTGQRPCSSGACLKISERHRSYCSEHQVVADEKCRQTRKKAPWNGHMVFSPALDEYFDDPDEAEACSGSSLLVELGRAPTNEEVRERLESYDLRLCEPQAPPYFDASQFLSDWLPSEDNGGDPHEIVASLRVEVEALNKAIQALPRTFYATEIALDPDAPAAHGEASS